MNINELIPSKYLKQSDVPEETLVTVQGLKKVNVAREDDDPDYKFVIKFAEFEKPMVLNSTNIKRLGKALGDETDGWKGGQVMLYVDPDIEFGGNIVGGLRIRAAKAPSKPSVQNAAGDDIPW